ncbi:unnamed protein product [Moneuplotes crassus]|uniref:Uncharacterized protein n=1 Tax=Euplotes crassus TaxID=5936 RepID=A0AAD1XYZ4_EUPCR|nr:unnamed protein product [Moneuplotes crassus]
MVLININSPKSLCVNHNYRDFFTFLVSIQWLVKDPESFSAGIYCRPYIESHFSLYIICLFTVILHSSFNDSVENDPNFASELAQKLQRIRVDFKLLVKSNERNASSVSCSFHLCNFKYLTLNF